MTKTNKKNHKRNKNLIRSTLTGKIINGREAILTEEAIEYVRKMGYIVKPLSQVYAKAALLSIGFMLSLGLLIPLVSAQPALFTMDFSLRQNQIILGLLFVTSGFLFWLVKQKLWGGSLLLMTGMLMAFNSINLVVSLFVMGIGILMLTQEES
jgi:hypothetical protein